MMKTIRFMGKRYVIREGSVADSLTSPAFYVVAAALGGFANLPLIFICGGF